MNFLVCGLGLEVSTGGSPHVLRSRVCAQNLHGSDCDLCSRHGTWTWHAVRLGFHVHSHRVSRMCRKCFGVGKRSSPHCTPPGLCLLPAGGPAPSPAPRRSDSTRECTGEHLDMEHSHCASVSQAVRKGGLQKLPSSSHPRRWPRGGLYASGERDATSPYIVRDFTYRYKEATPVPSSA